MHQSDCTSFSKGASAQRCIVLGDSFEGTLDQAMSYRSSACSPRVPLGHQAGSRSYQLHHLEHRGPADRLLIATAIELACPLVTYDERIVRFGKKHGRQYRFAVDA